MIKNKFINELFRVINNPLLIVSVIFQSSFFTKISDKNFYRIMYFMRTWKFLNLKKPRTFNEKIQYLKLHDRNHEYTKLVDKFEVRNIVKKKLGPDILVPIYGVFSNFNEINFEKLPNSFVIKCTHDSGSYIIVENKNSLDLKKTKKYINNKLSKNYFQKGREWPYKNVKPRIIVEKLLKTENDLNDYKVFCFNGQPKFIQVDFDRFKNHKRNIYDFNWKLLDIFIEYPNDFSKKIEKPLLLDQIYKCSIELSKNLIFSRIDFYISDSKLFFGEITLHHGSGYELIRPEQYNLKFGNWIKLK